MTLASGHEEIYSCHVYIFLLPTPMMSTDHPKSDMGMHFLRMSLGLIMVLGGINKLFVIPEGFANMVHGLSALGSMQDFVIMVLPWAELILGILLVVGLFLQVVSVLAAITFLLMIFVLGVFGGGIMPAYHSFTFLAAIALAIGGKQACCSIDGMFKKKAPVEKIKA